MSTGLIPASLVSTGDLFDEVAADFPGFQADAFQSDAFQIFGRAVSSGTWKTSIGLAVGNIKTVVGLAKASIKSKLGLTP